MSFYSNGGLFVFGRLSQSTEHEDTLQFVKFCAIITTSKPKERNRNKKMEASLKNSYTLIRTEAVTYSDMFENNEVFSILALESDGETAKSVLAYDVARTATKAKEILTEIERLCPPLCNFNDTVEELI